MQAGQNSGPSPGPAPSPAPSHRGPGSTTPLALPEPVPASIATPDAVGDAASVASTTLTAIVQRLPQAEAEPSAPSLTADQAAGAPLWQEEQRPASPHRFGNIAGVLADQPAVGALVLDPVRAIVEQVGNLQRGYRYRTGRLSCRGGALPLHNMFHE